MKNHTLSVLVENKPGVLARISGLFARRGYNIESLAVGPTERPGLSRITLEVAVATPQILEQIVKQLNKLVEVLKIVELEDDAVRRELVLIKVKADPTARSQIIEIVQLFRGKTVDVHNDAMTIEATGSPDKLDALLQMLKPYGVRELVQSGLVALDRGSRSLTERAKIEKARFASPNNQKD
ncbi:MAG: acetolactate synthase small subunit [Propionicimonas sp.]|uniref:acetolactate synthase small subunit n=1 Tax=Propionicimonas sp. TaxID=1955623 RepID=UPI002B20386C|nr:acetolactate synthase small subunit [Propionicimonas sp.]MEA4944058.1 acetolactate synthase small subunit [Propionicimonas sp.]MEA5053974.1 acetolactate synthase small subunit [Propionicimonas sp.]MEA5116708.1 acetolactate synthase small subunit [Propionicimonas sp.]